MGCCLSTAYQVDLVINKFSKYYSPVNNLQPNEFPQLVAGRILPVGNILTTPVSNKPCVYYTVKAEELEHKQRQVTDENGNTRMQHYTEWEYRYTDTRSVDFLIVDPANPTVFVYIPFSQTNHKLHCKTDSCSRGFPPNAQRPPSFNDMFSRHRHNPAAEWRYTESSFEYGEQVAVLGVIKEANVPGGKMLHPMTSNVLTDAYFEQNEWSSWEKSSWEDLTKVACIIVSDVPQFLKDKPIAPLPPNYSMAAARTQIFLPGYSAPPQQQMMMQQMPPQQMMMQQIPPQQMMAPQQMPPQQQMMMQQMPPQQMMMQQQQIPPQQMMAPQQNMFMGGSNRVHPDPSFQQQVPMMQPGFVQPGYPQHQQPGYAPQQQQQQFYVQQPAGYPQQQQPMAQQMMTNTVYPQQTY